MRLSRYDKIGDFGRQYMLLKVCYKYVASVYFVTYVQNACNTHVYVCKGAQQIVQQICNKCATSVQLVRNTMLQMLSSKDNYFCGTDEPYTWPRSAK